MVEEICHIEEENHNEIFEIGRMSQLGKRQEIQIIWCEIKKKIL